MTAVNLVIIKLNIINLLIKKCHELSNNYCIHLKTGQECMRTLYGKDYTGHLTVHNGGGTCLYWENTDDHRRR